jgi:hypothetical protein
MQLGGNVSLPRVTHALRLSQQLPMYCMARGGFLLLLLLRVVTDVVKCCNYGYNCPVTTELSPKRQS